MAAAHTVGSCVELLELIILQLPPPQVSKLRLVSKQWKDVIDSSPPIVRHGRSVRSPISEPFLQTYAKASNITPHPALQRFLETYTVHGGNVMKRFHTNFYDWLTDEELKFTNECATSPPITDMFLLYEETPNQRGYCEISNEEGIKIGEIFNGGSQDFKDMVARCGFSLRSRPFSITAAFEEHATYTSYGQMKAADRSWAEQSIERLHLGLGFLWNVTCGQVVRMVRR